MNHAAIAILSPAEVWDRLDPLNPDLDLEPSVAGLADLPYGQLKGPSFERLCYELLIAEQSSPRFFSRSGSRDYGVDIVVEKGEERTVYQCKNIDHPPSWTEVRDAVEKFERDWLGLAGLNAPTAYVYCCPHPLDSLEVSEEWTIYYDKFQSRTGVSIHFWGKDTLDTRLKRLPDVVAGLFSNSYAEHFCFGGDWRDSPWTRVHWNTARYRSVERFLDYHRKGRIQVSQDDEAWFANTLSANVALVIRGLPGSGKSMTGLALACRVTSPLRRIYYATLKDVPAPARLWETASRRQSLPCVFFLDDCHLDLELAGRFCRRLGHGAVNANVKIFFALRDSSHTEELDDSPEWLDRMERDGCVMNMQTDLARTRSVVEHLRPEFTGLSEHRLGRLHHQTV